jgi:hypothetical protein
LAPQGLDTLRRQLDALQAACVGVTSDASSAEPVEAIETRRSSIVALQRAGEQKLVALKAACERFRDAEIGRTATLKQMRQQREATAAELGSDLERTMHASTLQEALRIADEALAACVREASAWRGVAPDSATLARLRSDVVTAEDFAAQTVRRLHSQELIVRELEAALRAQFDDDVESAAIAADERKLEAEKLALDLETEVAALRLLDQSFTGVFQSDHNRIVRPIVNRMAPYLRAVFPQAEMELNTSFMPTRLKRDGDDEVLERLSHGAREQISIVVRMGLGRVLSDRGAEAPLILDDALVYADDQRIEAMFGALQEAARHHQVIVLTCRERTFARLDGQKLHLEPWKI